MLPGLTRRRFAFWIGFGLFSLAERLRVYGLDDLAANVMHAAKAPPAQPAPVHWRSAGNELWRWFERETLIKGRWMVSGITTPVNKSTGEAYIDRVGYLDEQLVPAQLRGVESEQPAADPADQQHDAEVLAQLGRHEPDPERAARHGRPPSKWLRSLHAAELRIWLRSITVPEATVEGMTYWTHLTRDHAFDPEKIAGLIEVEQAKLHAAAHHGY